MLALTAAVISNQRTAHAKAPEATPYIAPETGTETLDGPRPAGGSEQLWYERSAIDLNRDLGDVVNILLIGTDERLPGDYDRGRGDVTMLCSLNRTDGSVRLVSFERSTGVPWPGHGDVMLTNTFTYGGPELTAGDISRCFNVDIDGYMHVDFELFREIIDALGGIDIELTAQEARALAEDSYYEYSFDEGMNQMDGESALLYCRLRRIDDNWHRVERQRNMVQAVLTKSKSIKLSDIPGLARVVIPMVDTNLSREQLAALAVAAPKFRGASAMQMTVPDRNYIWVYNGAEEGLTGCDYGKESGRIREFLSRPAEIQTGQIPEPEAG
ncbi:MAG: LCP family protein [Candidatus Limivicinus sp.]